MTDEALFHAFYDIGMRWATDNIDNLRPFQAKRAELEKHVHETFNWEGFIETTFTSTRLYGLCVKNPSMAEARFVAGVCDAIYGT